MILLIIAVAILFLVSLAGWFAGRGLHRYIAGKQGSDSLEDQDLSVLRDTVAFISAAIGVLLGLLLSFSVGQFNDTQNQIKQLGTDSMTIYAATETISPEASNAIRHDVVCTLRSFVEQDWLAEGAQIGIHEQTTLWTMQLQQDIDKYEAEAIAQGTNTSGYGTIAQNALNISSGRQHILNSSANTIPAVIWVVIYFSAFVLSVCLSVLMTKRRTVGRFAFWAKFGTEAIIILAIIVLDYPLQDILGLGSAVNADALQNVFDMLEWQYPGSEWEGCPTLVAADLITKN